MIRPKPAGDPLVQRLVRKYAVGSAEVAIERYVDNCLAEANQRQLPINVELIASVLGIKRRVSEHPFAGRIYAEESGQLVMDLNASDPEPRRRFTCAHELIHPAFPGFTSQARYRLDVSVGDYHAARSEEEYLCDLGASMMLMPAPLVTHRYRIGEGLGDVEALAQDANASLEAAGNRLARLSERPAAFVVLEVCHKPADRTALRHGQHVEPRLRVRYAVMAHLKAFIPPYKSVPPDSVYVRALHSAGTVRGMDELPGVRTQSSLFRVQARCYPRREGDREIRRVLATATS